MSRAIHRKIPSRFAEKVVEKEITLEKQGTIDTLKPLLELYIVIFTQQGIEFYEAAHDEKYLYYKDKMDKVLASKKNILRSQRRLNSELEAEAAIKLNDIQNSSTFLQIHDNLDAQNGSLSERINSRKASFNRRKTYCPSAFRSLINNNIHNRIEEAIEQLVLEKFNRIKEVKRQYKKIMNSGNVLNTVEEMNKEVDRVEKEIEQKKKDVINRLMAYDC